ncbi:MAG: type IV pilin N-terminal domain-containing protein [Methanocorpusculum sp.]|nr:type IV pilin N-terminal domain-containing protein [Methanocorpusculum sp.]
MNAKNSLKKDDAVSPVVGVMLMLVVTIIIAALVASFAGNIGASTDQKPVVSVGVTYSQADGLLITNNGGNGGLNTEKFDVWIRPGEDMGDDFTHKTYHIPWANFTTVSDFGPGQTLFINATNLNKVVTDEGGGSKNAWKITASSNVGKTFYVELVDASGTFSKSKGVIQA